MRIFLAGGVTGNLNPAWKVMSRTEITPNGFIRGLQDANFLDKSMNIFLAGLNGKRKMLYPDILRGTNENIPCGERDIPGVYRSDIIRGGFSPDSDVITQYRPYILESFYYTDEDTERLIPYFGDFLLDSGAFTFMQGSHNKTINWDEYIEKYADFIVRNNVQKYFELDIDVVVGYERVLQFRKKLERLTNRPCIPVWHKSRGMQDFKKTCDEYGYIAVGGIVSGEIKSDEYGKFPALIKEAHKRGAKIHGLGFTALNWLKVCHFDSVDSTAWTTGNRFGFVYKFTGKTMTKIDAPKGKRLGDSRKVALINYTEWIKFQKYAETHL